MRAVARAGGWSGRIRFALVLTGLAWIATACAQSDTPREAKQSASRESTPASQAAAGRGVTVLQGKAQLDEAVRSAEGRLVMVDLYADWCGPCRMIAPVLEEVAREKQGTVEVYKVNIDHNRDLAAEFGVTGIPLVVFLRDGKVVHRLMGVQSKAAYLRAIDQFAPAAQQAPRMTPDGELVAGVRVIRVAGATGPEKLFVHRGETVRLVLAPTGDAYSIHIPAFQVSAEGSGTQELEVQFKVEEVGVFPIYCNGRCPLGGGAQQGALVVVPFEATGDTRFTEVTTAEAVDLIARARPLLLDVRTPAEYRDGHLADATLIPLEQLEGRLSEIASHRDRPILIYCRSGNRSTVAAEILAREGFEELYNLRHGIRDWELRGQPVVR